MCSYLKTLYSFNGLNCNTDSLYPADIFADLYQQQVAKWHKPPVLLIDEYDAPLTESMLQPELFEKVRTVLVAFYKKIKAISFFRFVFITGVTRFSQTSIFSALNMLNDLSMSPRFGTLLGLVKADLEGVLRPLVLKASRTLQLTEEELISELTSYYDNYCFDGKREHTVFNLWSVLNFLQEPENGFKPYWYLTGGLSTLMINYFKQRAFIKEEQSYSLSELEEKELLGGCLLNIKDLELSISPQTIDYRVLLFQTGYYTVLASENTSIRLGIPNLEVLSSITHLFYKHIYAADPLSLDKINRDLVVKSLQLLPRDVAKLQALFN